MTYSSWRRYGYVSRLKHLRCGGKPTTEINTGRQLEAEQAETARTERAQSAEDRARALSLEQPLIDKATTLATGDAKAALKASMPVVSKLSAGYDAAKQNIMNSIPPGAARTKALADLEIQKSTGVAGETARQVEEAPKILASIGSGFGGMSLQEVGAALSGYQGASATNTETMKAENEAKANQLGFFSSLASTAGRTATGLIRPSGGSDRRIKTNIRPVMDILDRLTRVAVYQFDYRGFNRATGMVGVMAQDIAETFPELVHQHEGVMAVNYEGLASIALAAVAALKDRVEALEARQVQQMELTGE